MKRLRLTEEIWKEGNMYVSYCPELDIASCGHDVWQAKKNLIEAIEINLEETKNLGTLNEFLEQCGIQRGTDDVMSARKELVGFTPIEVAVWWPFVRRTTGCRSSCSKSLVVSTCGQKGII